ncbi:hypothetical protein FEM48_Zijuj03G0002700 [Ziziphus jujuba var. spinosa]|uniref:Uncharacterized protein n=1 Tax=Ziziphus jujuba var. spinosa TaxID=714518 RepID=A0A978VM32_ZIZJJ|nr:hypothetical protein FEM48_Zijuj03G0002700 [Ziziphus jujuba var. spinosa]
MAKQNESVILAPPSSHQELETIAIKSESHPEVEASHHAEPSHTTIDPTLTSRWPISFSDLHRPTKSQKQSSSSPSFCPL